jgi:hypothetical protein
MAKPASTEIPFLRLQKSQAFVMRTRFRDAIG